MIDARGWIKGDFENEPRLTRSIEVSGLRCGVRLYRCRCLDYEEEMSDAERGSPDDRRITVQNVQRSSVGP